MLCKDVIKVLETICPTSYALDWDNVGLQAGSFNRDIHTIYIAVDATDEVIEEAIQHHADLLLTHHPLLFHGIKQIHDLDFIGRRILQLLQHNMCCYAMHTNYDVTRMGELAAQRLQLQHTHVLEVTSEDGLGIGQVGEGKTSLSLSALCEQVKTSFQLSHVRLFGNPEAQIQRIAISPGAGNSMIPHAIHAQADVLITGDISHHMGIDALAQGVAIIDAGHYGIEHIFLQDMANVLKKQLSTINIIQAPIAHPFQVL